MEQVELSRQKHLYSLQKYQRNNILLFYLHTLLSSFPGILLNTAGPPVVIHNCCVLPGEFCTSPENELLCHVQFTSMEFLQVDIEHKPFDNAMCHNIVSNINKQQRTSN